MLNKTEQRYSSSCSRPMPFSWLVRPFTGVGLRCSFQNLVKNFTDYTNIENTILYGVTLWHWNAGVRGSMMPNPRLLKSSSTPLREPQNSVTNAFPVKHCTWVSFYLTVPNDQKTLAPPIRTFYLKMTDNANETRFQFSWATLKIEKAMSPETLVRKYQSIQCHFPDDCNILSTNLC